MLSNARDGTQNETVSRAHKRMLAMFKTNCLTDTEDVHPISTPAELEMKAASPKLLPYLLHSSNTNINVGKY